MCEIKFEIYDELFSQCERRPVPSSATFIGWMMVMMIVVFVTCNILVGTPISMCKYEIIIHQGDNILKDKSKDPIRRIKILYYHRDCSWYNNNILT